METKEYKTVDKSGWAERGPWDHEPDKVQWSDDATDLPCLIVRGPVGAWCGYVGVDESHPWHGKDYDSIRLPETEDCDGYIDVHGDLTFARGCSPHGHEEFAAFEKRMVERRDEAKRYPRGDAAEYLRTLSHLVGNYEAWKDHMQASSICHLAAPGEPAHVWWFGFDCAHSGDICPKYDDKDRYSWGYSQYRDMDYVKAEVRKLAKQLRAVA